VQVLELAEAPDPTSIEFTRLWNDEAEELFGQRLVKAREYVVYPGKAQIVDIEPQKETSSLLAAGIFRSPTARRWFSIMSIPDSIEQRTCTQIRPPPAEFHRCLFISLDGYDLHGSHLPPPSIDISQVETLCSKGDTAPSRARRPAHQRKPTGELIHRARKLRERHPAPAPPVASPPF
jgi:hypothetical protein